MNKPQSDVRRTYDPRTTFDPVQRLLEKTTNPRHRAILENHHIHGLLEVTGRWQQILKPALTVEHPHYCHSDGLRTTVYDGRESVATFYRGLFESGMLNLLGPMGDDYMVSDWGFSTFGMWGYQLTGRMAQSYGFDVDDLEAHYYMTQYQTQVWRYNENAKLTGEYILEDPSTRSYWKMHPSEVQSGEAHLTILEEQYQEAIQLPQYRSLLGVQ
jgi:hypothetical protein